MRELKTGTALVPSASLDGETLRAKVRGEIDLHNSPELRVALLEMVAEHEPKKLVLDVGEVPYMDSSAIAVLVETMQKMRKTGGKIYLINPQSRVKGLLEIARLDTIFVVGKDEQEVLAK